MTTRLEDVFPIMDVEHDCIVSKQGDVTVAYKLTLPEIFTLSADQYTAFHQLLVKAIKVMPRQSIFHKQDWFIEKKFRPEQPRNASFLANSSDPFFTGRPYLDHWCYGFLTKKPASRKDAPTLTSSLP